MSKLILPNGIEETKGFEGKSIDGKMKISKEEWDAIKGHLPKFPPTVKGKPMPQELVENIIIGMLKKKGLRNE